MRYVVALLILIGGLIGGFFAVSSVLWQERAITEFVRTPATILSSSVGVHRGKHTEYSADITYCYVVNGQTYQSSTVRTFNFNMSYEGEAEELVNRYPVSPIQQNGVERGMPIANNVAYVNPREPSDAILVREYEFTPYVFAFIALFVALVGVGGLFADTFTVGRETMTAVALDDSGWQLVVPRQNLKRSLRNAVIWCVGMTLIVVPLGLHWFVIVRQHSIGSVIASLAAAGVLMAMGVTVFRRWSVARHVSDVRLRIKPVPLVRGQPFFMEMEADAFSPLRVRSAKADVTCTEHYKERRGSKTQIGTRKRGEVTVALTDAKDVSTGQVVDGKGEATVPADFPPSSDLALKTFPYYTWQVRVTIVLAGMPDYVGDYPVEVD